MYGGVRRRCPSPDVQHPTPRSFESSEPPDRRALVDVKRPPHHPRLRRLPPDPAPRRIPASGARIPRCLGRRTAACCLASPLQSRLGSCSHGVCRAQLPHHHRDPAAASRSPVVLRSSDRGLTASAAVNPSCIHGIRWPAIIRLISRSSVIFLPQVPSAGRVREEDVTSTST